VIGSISDVIAAEFYEKTTAKEDNNIANGHCQRTLLLSLRPQLHQEQLQPNQRRLLAAVQGGTPHQTAPPRLHNPPPPLDIHAVVQGPALRVHPDHHALLHLRHHWHAGGEIIFRGINYF